MMDDPTPTKRPRLLSETISYIMKPKRAPTVDVKPSQQLQGMPFVWEQCGREVKTQSGISKHKATHAREGKYFCCGKAFLGD
ncbi:hypothetical protein DPMN_102922 [Dreissena polymorpha]|uniref:C2H2-type domain-containing protein n=1 Tax=Dreissena polymorpha TaxID=45954 RepID=A0A9D4HA57_DREPO|nr:hypothetical protein DPMN_102922 [Dreissena polymorpha]